MAQSPAAQAQPSGSPAEQQESESVPHPAETEGPATAVSLSSIFGSRGQWVILSTSNVATISSRTYSASEANFFDLDVGIGVDWFVVRNLSIGIDLEASYQDSKGYGATTLIENSSTHLAGGVRFGVNVPLGGFWSLYPRVTFGFDSNHGNSQTIEATTSAPAPAFSTSQVGPWLNLYVPFLVHPVSHAFLGFGPHFQHIFAPLRGGPYDGSQTSLVSADFVIGGWWGGPAETAPALDTAPKAPRFGDHGQIVLTSATSATIGSSTYTHSSASSVNAMIEPGFDYFIGRQVSLGADMVIGYSNATSFDSNGVETTSTQTSIGIGPRIGVALPLFGDSFTFWPQFELGFAFSGSQQSSALGTNDHADTGIWIQASAPILFHVAPHFFLGAGPILYHDLSRTDQTGFDNDATSVGGSVLMGAWL